MSTSTEAPQVESTREPYNPLAGFDKNALPNLELAMTVGDALSLLSPAEFSQCRNMDEAVLWVNTFWRHPAVQVLDDPKSLEEVAKGVMTLKAVISEAGRYVFLDDHCEPYDNPELLLKHLYPLSDWSNWQKVLSRFGRFVKLDSISLATHKDLDDYYKANTQIVGDSARLMDNIARGSFEIHINAWDCDHDAFMAFRRTVASLRQIDQKWYLDSVVLR